MFEKKENKDAEFVPLHSFKSSLTSSKSDDGSIQLLHNQLMRRLRSVRARYQNE
jgi:hypothetical protein